MNQLDASLAIMEKILTTQDMNMHEFDKRFFKLTLETFKQSALGNQDTSKKQMDTFDSLCQKIQADNHLNELDLTDLVANFGLIKKKQIKNATAGYSPSKKIFLIKNNKRVIAKKKDSNRSLSQNNKIKDQNGNYFCKTV